jgi:hypothetical protein
VVDQTSVSVVLDHNVLPQGQISARVPNLRQGDVDQDTGKLTINGVDWPAVFSADFAHETVCAYNASEETIPAGATAEISWRGFIIEDQVQDHEQRIAKLEAGSAGKFDTLEVADWAEINGAANIYGTVDIKGVIMLENFVGFYGANPQPQPTVTGSRSDGTALMSLLDALTKLGLVVDNTTA